MGLTLKQLHSLFVGEVSPIELRRVHDEDTLAAIRAGMDEYAVLVFHAQPFTDDEHLAFAQQLDGALHTKLGSAAIQKNRFGNEALGDVSPASRAKIMGANAVRFYGLRDAAPR